jgi:hypothetical protein
LYLETACQYLEMECGGHTSMSARKGLLPVANFTTLRLVSLHLPVLNGLLKLPGILYEALCR